METTSPCLMRWHAVFVARQPCDRADRARCKQEAVAVVASSARHPLGKMREQRHARAIVVGERGVADMGRKQELVLGLAPDADIRHRSGVRPSRLELITTS